jgi:hypothetical protein
MIYLYNLIKNQFTSFQVGRTCLKFNYKYYTMLVMIVFTYHSNMKIRHLNKIAYDLKQPQFWSS